MRNRLIGLALFVLVAACSGPSEPDAGRDAGRDSGAAEADRGGAAMRPFAVSGTLETPQHRIDVRIGGAGVNGTLETPHYRVEVGR